MAINNKCLRARDKIDPKPKEWLEMLITMRLYYKNHENPNLDVEFSRTMADVIGGMIRDLGC